MKRTPLKRSSSLSRGSGPARMGKSRRPSMAGFWWAVTEGGTEPCAICGRDPFAPPFPRMEAHHYVRKSRLPDSAFTDERNGVCLCATPCHERVTNARIACPRPPMLDDFLKDHGLLESGRPIPKGRT